MAFSTASGERRGKSANIGFNPKTLVIAGILALVLTGGGVWGALTTFDQGPSAEEQQAATRAVEAERWRREEEPHGVNLMSFAVPLLNGRRLASVLVLIRLQVGGTDGLGALCRKIPLVREAVLRVFSTQGIEVRDRNSRIELAPYEAVLLKKINGILSETQVQSVNATQLHPLVAGVRSRETSAKFREFLEVDTSPEAGSNS